MRRLTIAAFLTVPVGLALVACLATEKDRGQALADGIRYVQAGCLAYLSDSRIPRHPEPDALCPVLTMPPAVPELDDAMVSDGAAPRVGTPGPDGGARSVPGDGG